MNSDYKVDVYADAAFTIMYDDSDGRLLFSIEVGDDPKKIFLNPHPSQFGRMVDLQNVVVRERVNLAIERVKAYFRSKGLSVELD